MDVEEGTIRVARSSSGCGRLFQFKVGLAFLATARKDGAPRLHPAVCPVLSNDRLFVLITPTSPKRYDLLRDGGYALQTCPQPRPGSDEFYIAGKAVLVASGGSPPRPSRTHSSMGSEMACAGMATSKVEM